MHRLVDPQTFDVGPVENGPMLAAHLVGAEYGSKRDVLRLRGRGESRQHVRQGDSDPRNHHRPRLHAPQPIDVFLQAVGLHDVLVVVLARLPALSEHLDLPGLRGEIPRVAGGIALVRPELVEVVVARDVGVRGRLLIGPVGALDDAFELLPPGVRIRGEGGGPARPEQGQAAAEERRGGEARGVPHESPPVSEHRPGGDLRGLDVVRSFDQHDALRGSTIASPEDRPPAPSAPPFGATASLQSGGWTSRKVHVVIAISVRASFRRRRGGVAGPRGAGRGPLHDAIRRSPPALPPTPLTDPTSGRS